MASNKKTEELTGVFAGERYVFQDGTPNRTIIGSLQDGITIKGEASYQSLRVGCEYRFDGQWKTHPKYGKQFVFYSFCQPTPTTRESLIRYISTCPGIGSVRAGLIVDEFGNDSLETLKRHPENVAQKISGLTQDMCQNIAEDLIRREHHENYTIEINTLLGGHGFPKRIYSQIYNDFGTKAAEVIRLNPFILMNYPGVGFLKADALYLQLGLDPRDLMRQVHYIEFLMTSDSTGSTKIEIKKLRSALEEFIGSEANFDEALEQGIDIGLFVRRGDFASLFHWADNEEKIADYVHISGTDSINRWPEKLVASGGNEPSNHQLEEYKSATKGKLGIIAGSPGTGKTWLVARIIESIKKTDHTLAVAAPTGKARGRITESLAAQGVNETAATIHSLLQAEIVAGGGFTFRYNESNRLPFDFVIVDESSMIDNHLLACLLNALRPEAHLLLVGDPDQLSPVGRGAPLRDLIVAGVPCGKLHEIRRNAGAIVHACASIREEKMFDCHTTDPNDLEKNLVLVKVSQETDPVMKTIREIVERENVTSNDVQVVVATNEKSPVSRKILNKHLCEFFNPCDRDEKRRFEIYDKVICLANGNAETANNQGQIRVANGDVGFIENDFKECYHVDINDNIAVVPKHGDTWSAYNFDFGYSITVHKSQGSEWPVVIIILDASFAAGMICDRHWIYTAISRARNRCYILGSESQVKAMIKKSKMWERETTLVERIREMKWSNLSKQWELVIS